MRAVPPLGGTDGDLFIDRNVAVGEPGSVVPAEIFNALRSEVLEVIETLGGLTPDAGDLTQLRKAIVAYVAAAGMPAATVDETWAGTLDNKAVTPASLKPLIDRLQANVALAHLRTLAVGGLGPGLYADGVADDFEDQSGVDLIASSGAEYDTQGGFYVNLPGNQIPGGEGTLIGDLTANGGLAAAFDGMTDVTLLLSASSTSSAATGNVGKSWSTGRTVNRARVFSSSDNGFQTGGLKPTTIGLEGFDGSTWIVLDSVVTQDKSSIVVELSYAGGVAYSQHRITVNVSGPLDGAIDVAEVIFFQPVAPLAMSLVGLPASAMASPRRAQIVVLAEPVDPVVVNTDLIASASRDDGTTWTPATLVSQGSYGDGLVIFSGDADLTAQPAGTQMRWRIETTTAEQRIHAVAMTWT